MKFIPWPLQTESHIRRNPYDISTWGPSCARGFVSASRFQVGTEQVLKRANRSQQRKHGYYMASDSKEIR